MKKKGKRIINDSYEGFSTTYGTVDYTTNKSVYVDISSWIEPLVDDEPKQLTSLLKKTIKNAVYETIPNSPFLPHYIVDLDLRESGMKMDKKSFMSCDITLYTSVDLPHVTDDIQIVVDSVIEAVRDRFKDIFDFNRRKKP